MPVLVLPRASDLPGSAGRAVPGASTPQYRPPPRSPLNPFPAGADLSRGTGLTPDGGDAALKESGAPVSPTAAPARGASVTPELQRSPPR